MKQLFELFVRRPVFTWVLVLMVSVLGLNGLSKMSIERYPNIDFGFVSVSIAAPGLSAEQVEAEISTRAENALGTVGGLERLDSISSEGMSLVMAQFALSKNQSDAANEVRDRIARLTDELPPTAKPARIETYNANASPVLLVSLSSPTGARSMLELTELADTSVRRELQAIQGVGEVKLIGGEQRSFTIRLDPLLLAAANITAQEVQTALQRENLEVPGGSVADGERNVGIRLSARARDAAELSRLIVARQGPVSVRLENVGEVIDGPQPRTSIALMSGQPTVIVAVAKAPGANTVRVVDEVRDRLTTARALLPDGVEVNVLQDNSEDIRASLHAVTEHLVLGAIFAAVVVLLFLRSWKATLIAGLAIPTSIIGTFAVAHALGLSLNMLSLLGLTLAVGIVIDDAIVVVENIFRVMNTSALTPAEAAVAATREIGLAILATTLSLVAVFLPVATMDGIVGRYLAPFGLTMSASILISMLIAFTLTPMLSSRWLKRPTSPEAHGSHGRLERWYTRALTWLMPRRWVAGLAIAATLLSIVPLAALLPMTFVPVEDNARFAVYVGMPEGVSVERTGLEAERIAVKLRAMEGVTQTVVTTTSDTEATILVNLASRGLQEDAMAAARTALVKQDSPVLLMFGPGDEMNAVGPDGAAIQFVVRGNDLDELERLSQALLAYARTLPGTVDHGARKPGRTPELSVAVDRALASQLGVAQVDLGGALSLLDRQGVDLGSMRDVDGASDVAPRLRLRVGSEAMTNEETLRALAVRGANGALLPLSQLATVKSSEGPGMIRRVGRQRQVTLFMNTLPGTSDLEVLDALTSRLRALDPGGEYTNEVLGNAKEMQKAVDAFVVAILLSFVFMYLVLAAQFESWVHPVTILASLPLTVPFGLFSLLVGGQSLNLFSGLGFLVLFGIVKKNSILQVDRMVQLREQGRARAEAVIEACVDRLRPILMTTIAFVAGMLPLVVSSGAGAATNRAIAVGILGGQTLSLALTLLVTPVLYTWFDDLIAWRATRRSRAHLTPAPGAPT